MFPAHVMYRVLCFDFGSVENQLWELTETLYSGGQIAKHPWSWSEMSRWMTRFAIGRMDNLVCPSHWAMRVCHLEVRVKARFLLREVFESQSHRELVELVLEN